MAKPFLTLGEVAKHFGCFTWQVARLFERKILPEPPRVGQVRAIPPKDLPKIGQALRAAGYLK